MVSKSWDVPFSDLFPVTSSRILQAAGCHVVLAVVQRDIQIQSLRTRDAQLIILLLLRVKSQMHFFLSLKLLYLSLEPLMLQPEFYQLHGFVRKFEFLRAKPLMFLFEFVY